MEIVIGIILLIRAFALGQSTVDQDAAESRACLEREQLATSSQDGFVPQGCRYRISGPVKRDLTVPYSRQQRNEGVDFKETKVAFRND